MKLYICIETKPVLLGPVSYLLSGKEKEAGFHRLELLERLLPVYVPYDLDLETNEKTLTPEIKQWMVFESP